MNKIKSFTVGRVSRVKITEGLYTSLAGQPLAKNGGSGNTAILKLFCRNAINILRGVVETLLKVN